jgi:hypothetical protein
MLPLLAATRLSGFGFLLLVVVAEVTIPLLSLLLIALSLTLNNDRLGFLLLDPPLPLLIALSLTLNDAKRVELRWGANSSAISRAAFRAAVRVERLVGTEGLVAISSGVSKETSPPQRDDSVRVRFCSMSKRRFFLEKYSPSIT